MDTSLVAHEPNWVCAGYFLVTDGESPEKNRLPARIVTVSACIAETHPDAWALPWTRTPTDELRAIQERLGLDDAEFEQVRSWVGWELDAGAFGWPNVFLSLTAALAFKNRFLGRVEDVRVLGLSLAEDEAAEFLREEAPEEGSGALGMWTMLARRESLPSGGRLLGFDVLGLEYGGTFHTFWCNDLRQDYVDRCNVSINEIGLIETYEMAARACEYTNRDEVGAEPVPWYPFRVDQY